MTRPISNDSCPGRLPLCSVGNREGARRCHSRQTWTRNQPLPVRFVAAVVRRLGRNLDEQVDRRWLWKGRPCENAMRPSTLAAACLLLLGPAARAADRPNVVILLADDYGYADAGFQGCTDIPTPHLDAIAKSGVRCTNGYVSGPYCSPTRAGLLTGRYQTRFGHEFNPGAGPNIGLPLTEVTLADRLKAAGYATGWVGKWHLGNAEKFRPPHRGFDDTFGFLGGAHSYFPEKAKADVFRGGSPVDEKEYLTDAFGREAAAF